MALAFSKNSFHVRLEFSQHVQRNKGLNGSGKPAAVNTVSSAITEEQVAHRKRHRYFLMLHSTGRGDVLQVHPRAFSGFFDKRKETIKVIVFQCFHLLFDALGFLLEVNGA